MVQARNPAGRYLSLSRFPDCQGSRGLGPIIAGLIIDMSGITPGTLPDDVVPGAIERFGWFTAPFQGDTPFERVCPSQRVCPFLFMAHVTAVASRRFGNSGAKLVVDPLIQALALRGRGGGDIGVQPGRKPQVQLA